MKDRPYTTKELEEYEAAVDASIRKFLEERKGDEYDSGPCLVDTTSESVV